MNCGSPGQRPFFGKTPVFLLLVLCLHLQGSSCRCIDQSFGQDLQPMPPGVERCSLPEGLLQPDIAPPGQGRDNPDAGDNRIVGGRPATSGERPFAIRPPSPGESPFQYGKPGKPWQGGIFGGKPAQYGKPREPGQFGSSPLDGAAAGSAQFGGSTSGFGTGYNRQGFPHPEWKDPGIPYIPTAEERGGAHIPISDRPSAPYLVPYGGGGGGGSGTYSTGQRNPLPYDGGSIASGPRGRYDGSYGPTPESVQPGGPPGKYSSDQKSPCTPNC